jgi:hypothetical protein
MVIASNPDPGVGGWAARCAAAPKDLDNDHTAAAARAWRAMIGRDVGIGCVARLRRIDGRPRGDHQLPGARDVGFAARAGEQPVVADAMKPFGRTWSRKRLMNSSALSVIVRYRACPLRR